MQDNNDKTTNNVSVEKLDTHNVNSIMAKISEYSDSIKNHKVDTDKVSKFATLSAYSKKPDQDFYNFIESMLSLKWVEIYQDKVNHYLDSFEKKAHENLRKLEGIKDNISALQTYEEDGIVWDKAKVIKFNLMIFATVSFALLFSSVSFFAILYSSWDGLGSPFIRESVLDYFPAMVTALFASVGGILLKLSVSTVTKKESIDKIVKNISILLILLIPMYVSLIIAVVTGGEFSIGNTGNFFTNLFTNIYFVITVHIILEMIMVFLAIHHLIRLNDERKKIVIENNPQYKKIESFLAEQENHIIYFMGMKAELEKVIEEIYTNRFLLKTDYELSYNGYKKRKELEKTINDKDVKKMELHEKRLNQELESIKSEIEEFGSS
ncbi:MAG: hypothetical protein KAH22_07455 [Thiotrichaceae bacterium]|nr:hypothetical protein [Thiotrichaceae bacterium]